MILGAVAWCEGVGGERRGDVGSEGHGVRIICVSKLIGCIGRV